MLRLRGDRFAFLPTFLAVLLSLLSFCAAHELERRATPIPSPISVTPDQNWDGIAGQWSTFTVRVGTPAQFVRVYLSTASQQTWVVLPEACLKANSTIDIDISCSDARGNLFNVTKSSTWDQVGFYMLWTEGNLGYTGNGQFGYDTVGLGGLGDEGPTLLNTTVGAMITEDFYLGHFGVNPKSTNFSSYNEPSPSYMTYLWQQKKIPSVSFGYSAGAQYRFTSVLASLTLGGYDSSKFVPNNLTFGFASDNERDIVVVVQDIRMTSETKSNVDLLPNPVAMYIDSTIPEIWLPLEACKKFEEAFGLTYDNATDLYLVSDLLDSQLIAQNPNVTFTLGPKVGAAANETVDIVLPYAAFNQRAKPPYRGMKNESSYFPLRRAANESQFVFGRTFLQEAYLIVDWERQNFSVHQASWVFGANSNIMPIISPTLKGSVGDDEDPKRLSIGAIIGVALGSGFAVAMVAFGIIFWIWKRRHTRKIKAKYEAAAVAAKEQRQEKQEEIEPSSPKSSSHDDSDTKVFPKAELPAEFYSRQELRDGLKPDGMPSPALSDPAEVDNSERQVFEMLGDIPQRSEADGRQLSEKETLMYRERVYNGVDPTGPPAVSPAEEDANKRLAPVSPSQVAVVNSRGLHNVSPTTPRAPRDGRFLEAEDTIRSPISPLDSSTGGSSDRRRFSYE